MTAYKGIHSFRGEQTSSIIKLLVREYVLIHTPGSLPYTLLQRNRVLPWSVHRLKSSYSIIDQLYSNYT